MLELHMPLLTWPEQWIARCCCGSETSGNGRTSSKLTIYVDFAQAQYLRPNISPEACMAFRRSWPSSTGPKFELAIFPFRTTHTSIASFEESAG